MNAGMCSHDPIFGTKQNQTLEKGSCDMVFGQRTVL